MDTFTGAPQILFEGIKMLFISIKYSSIEWISGTGTYFNAVYQRKVLLTQECFYEESLL